MSNLKLSPDDKKLLNTNFGKLLTPKNKRNIKNKDILLNRHVYNQFNDYLYIYYNNNYETEYKIKNKLSKNIINYINSDIKLKSIFNHSLRKYKIKILLEYVIKILYSNLPFLKYYIVVYLFLNI